MRFGEPLRRYWPEMLLFLAVALPWLSLLAQLYQLGEKSEQHQGMRLGGLHYIR